MVHGDPVPVALEISDGSTNLYPQAEIYGDGVHITTVDLTHVGDGFYRYAGYVMPSNDIVTVVYIVYTDAIHTALAGYNRDIDTFCDTHDELDKFVEGTLTMKHILRLIGAALLGKSDGGGTASVLFRDIGDSKNRIEATITAVGNRTSVTLDASD